MNSGKEGRSSRVQEVEEKTRGCGQEIKDIYRFHLGLVDSGRLNCGFRLQARMACDCDKALCRQRWP